MGNCFQAVGSPSSAEDSNEKLMKESGSRRESGFTKDLESIIEDMPSLPSDTQQMSDLDDKAFLPLPPLFQLWFPPTHAHSDCTDLFPELEDVSPPIYIADNSNLVHVSYGGEPMLLQKFPKREDWGATLFVTESRVLRRLQDHHGVLKFVDIYMDTTNFYLLTEVADYNLLQVLQHRGHISERKCKRIIYELLDALAYVHRRGICHRDIKPQNIVFRKGANSLQPLFTFFGDAEYVRNHHTYTEFVGTPGYMAPERLRNHSGLELKKSDVFALGVVCYEMLTGQPCFDAITREDIFKKVRRSKWKWPPHCKLSKHCKSFVESLLRPDPLDRPSAVRALRHEWLKSIHKKVAASSGDTTPVLEAVGSYAYDEELKVDQPLALENTYLPPLDTPERLLKLRQTLVNKQANIALWAEYTVIGSRTPLSVLFRCPNEEQNVYFRTCFDYYVEFSPVSPLNADPNSLVDTMFDKYLQSELDQRSPFQTDDTTARMFTLDNFYYSNNSDIPFPLITKEVLFSKPDNSFIHTSSMLMCALFEVNGWVSQRLMAQWVFYRNPMWYNTPRDLQREIFKYCDPYSVWKHDLKSDTDCGDDSDSAANDIDAMGMCPSHRRKKKPRFPNQYLSVLFVFTEPFEWSLTRQIAFSSV